MQPKLKLIKLVSCQIWHIWILLRWNSLDDYSHKISTKLMNQYLFGTIENIRKLSSMIHLPIYLSYNVSIPGMIKLTILLLMTPHTWIETVSIILQYLFQLHLILYQQLMESKKKPSKLYENITLIKALIENDDSTIYKPLPKLK